MDMSITVLNDWNPIFWLCVMISMSGSGGYTSTFGYKNYTIEFLEKIPTTVLLLVTFATANNPGPGGSCSLVRHDTPEKPGRYHKSWVIDLTQESSWWMHHQNVSFSTSSGYTVTTLSKVSSEQSA